MEWDQVSLWLRTPGLGDGEKDRMVLISIFCSSANLLVIVWDD